MKQWALPYRQIHLDFHTGPAIDDVGRDFDARDFARTMKRAHVNSVTVFAKCHHGHLYYNTKRPERHPGLAKGIDLLARQIDALHRENIRAPIYISVQCDEYAANTHPEWVARRPDSSQVKTPPGVFSAAWQILDMSTPYQEYLAEQTREILARFKPVDGIFFDMCWDQRSTTRQAIAGMKKIKLNPELEEDRLKWGNVVAHRYMKRFREMVKRSSPQASVFFNGRAFGRLHEELQYQEQIEIEALATGGWGYMYFPMCVRHARRFPKPYMGMTARFHKSWADFGGLKPYPALEYETSQMIAHGARCSIGDQLHPRGKLDRAAYELIGRAFQRVQEREPWLNNARAITDIGVVRLPDGDLSATRSAGGSEEGATRMLMQLKHQFDIISEDDNLSAYRLIILPDALSISDALRRKLRAYLKAGGALLATGTSALASDGATLLLPELKIKPLGMSPFTTTYIRFGRELSADIPPTDHVMYERGVRVTADKGAQALAHVVEPYFERTWDHFSSHFQTPPHRLTRFAAATVSRRAAYISFPIFRAFARHGNAPFRMLVRNMVNLLLPEPLVRIDAPTGTEVSVMRQDKRTIVHVLHYSPERRAKDLDLVEDIVPLRDVPISIRLEHPPLSAYLAPQRQALRWRFANGRCELTIPEVRGHAMVILE
jgi:hypothetical protein